MIITINDDFDMKKIADSGQAFRIKEIVSAPTSTYRFITQQYIVYITQISEITYDISCSMDEWNRIWVPYFDLTRNYETIRKTIPAADSFHSMASQYGQGIRILCQDPFEMLVTFIISQRKNIPAIKASVEKLCSLFGTPIETELETVYTFPTPDQLSKATTEELSTCSLGYRLPYIEDAINKVCLKEIDLELLKSLSTEDLNSTLLSIKGVGKKVANCINLFAYNRLECAPVDVWIEKVINQYFGGTNPYPSFGDTAGILQQYAFYYMKSL